MNKTLQRDKLVPCDMKLLGVVLALVIVGVLLVFDSSFARAGDHLGNPSFYASKQLLYAAGGVLAMLLAAQLPMVWLKRHAANIMWVAAAMLVIVLVIGSTVNGAKSYLKYFGMCFQPSEAAKIALIIFLAATLSAEKIFARRAPKFWKKPLWIAGAIVALVVAQKDLGTAGILVITVYVIYYCAGAKNRAMIPAALVGIVLAATVMLALPHSRDRIVGWLHPYETRLKQGYQVTQTLIGYGTGGLTGIGLCEGRVKTYIPASHNDYIVTTLAEESGLAGVALLMGAFFYFSLRGFDLAARCKSRFTSLLAAGITSCITAQALVNIAVTTNLIPSTGLPLPLISYGGSSLVTTLIGIGILLSVSRHVNVEMEESYTLESTHHGRRDRRPHIPRDKRRSSSRPPVYGYGPPVRR